MDNLLNDYEHRVKRKIERCGGRAGFPQPADYHVTAKQVDDYLFDKQVALDSEGTPRTRHTIAGILIVLPVLVVSAIPDSRLPYGDNTAYLAIVVGLLLACGAWLAGKLMVKAKLRKLYQKDVEDYLEAVINY